MKFSAIYCILNLENGRHYIGSAVDFKTRKSIHIHRLNNKRHHNSKLQNSWNKRGKEAFRFDVLEIVDDRKMLIEREQFWIDATLPFYNICRIASSALGVKRTPEQIAKMREISQNFWDSKDGNAAKAKMSATKTGTVTSNETKKKLSDIFKGVKLKPEHVAKISASLTGKKLKPLTTEQKEHLSKVLTGRKQSKSSIEKSRLARLGFKHTDESIELMKLSKRKISYVITSPNGVIHHTDDVKGFSKLHELDYQSMYRAARGVQPHHKGWFINKIAKAEQEYV